MRVLAIDDDQNVLDLLKAILSSDGLCKLDTFSSPDLALTALNSRISRYDCIILDIMMPELDGISLCRKIKKNPGHSKTPIIMLTRKSDENIIRSAFAEGASDFITKPFDINEVVARVRLASELCALRNENRALRLRSRIEKRREKLTKLEGVGAEIDSEKHCSLPGVVAAQDVEVNKARERVGHISQNEIVQLFSKELSDHLFLHRRQRAAQAAGR